MSSQKPKLLKRGQRIFIKFTNYTDISNKEFAYSLSDIHHSNLNYISTKQTQKRKEISQTKSVRPWPLS